MNINIIITHLEHGVDAVTTPNDDGTYTIAINIHLCEDRARKALLHEITHIKKRRLFKFRKSIFIGTNVARIQLSRRRVKRYKFLLECCISKRILTKNKKKSPHPAPTG